MDSIHHPGQNHLLAELQEAEFGRLSPFPELVRMARGDMLYQSGGNLMHLSFPTTAIISIDYVLEDGGASEIAGHVTVSTTQRSRPMNRPARPAPAQPAPTPATAAEQHEEYALDEALRESFPASDPVAVDVHATPRPNGAADRRT